MKHNGKLPGWEIRGTKIFVYSCRFGTLFELSAVETVIGKLEDGVVGAEILDQLDDTKGKEK
jgi:hypothetical protein